MGFLDCGDRFLVVRDPTAAQPCFHADQGGVTLVFSHLQDCPFIDRFALSLNLGFLSKLLVYDKIQTGETGLKAAGHLRATSAMVVQARAARYETVHVSLSGGLDSAIVLACLAGATGTGRVGALHYRLASGDLSEAAEARAAAAFAGIPLEIAEIAPNRDLPDVTAHPATARPYRSFIGETPFPSRRRDPDGRAALFTGQGGDHLFLERRSPLAFADHVLAHGLTAETLPALLRAARLSQRSIWDVLLACLPALAFGRRESVMQSAIRHRQETVAALLHGRTRLDGAFPEWAGAARGLPPAKFLQVSSLPHMVQVADAASHPDAPDLVHPLISQPLMTLCLRLPVSLLSANGESRGLARQAFDGMIPDRIRRRMTKGSASGFFMEFLEANAGPLGDALRSGVLIELGLIDRTDLAGMTRQARAGVHGLGRSLLIAYTIEAWLRTWTGIIGNPGKRA